MKFNQVYPGKNPGILDITESKDLYSIVSAAATVIPNQSFIHNKITEYNDILKRPKSLEDTLI